MDVIKVRNMVTIFAFFISLNSNICSAASDIETQKYCGEILNKQKLASIVPVNGKGSRRFDFSKGLVVTDPYSGNSLLMIPGNYIAINNSGYKTFVAIYECNKNVITLNKLLRFYANHIEYIVYDKDKNKVAVVFVDQSELHGLIEWSNKNYQFVMFEDPDL